MLVSLRLDENVKDLAFGVDRAPPSRGYPGWRGRAIGAAMIAAPIAFSREARPRSPEPRCQIPRASPYRRRQGRRWPDRG